MILVSFGVGGRAEAITIVLNDITGMTANQLNGFQQAAAAWESLLDDPVTVRLDVGFAALGGSVLGSTSLENFAQSYANIRTALVTDLVSADDVTATTNLPAAPSLRILTTNHSTGAQFLDNDGSVNNDNLIMARANAKALGLSTNLLDGDPDIPDPNDTSVADATILFNSGISFDTNPLNGISGGSFDLVGVAIHEIGHALGFVSGVDTVDALSNPNRCSGCTATDLNGFVVFSPLDLYRYSPNSFSNTAIAGHQAGSPYFSLDAGASSIVTFSTGAFDGDGRQASHWKDGLGIGILDPTLGQGELGIISQTDLRAFDVVGWDLSPEGLNNSVITISGATPVAFGRVMVGTSPSQDLELSKTGSKATTYSVSTASGVSVTASGTFAAGNQTEDISIDVTGAVATTGVKSLNGNFVDNTAPTATAAGVGSNDPNNVFTVTATAVDNRLISASAVNFGSVFVGNPVSDMTTLSTTGSDDVRTRVTVGGSAVTADSNGIGVDAGSAQLFDDAADSVNRTVSGMFSSAGAAVGNLNFNVVEEGLSGESVNSVSVAYTATALDHGTGSFFDTGDPDSPVITRTIDFGTVLQNAPVATMNLNIFNLEDTTDFTAALDFGAAAGSGDTSTLTTNLSSIGATSLDADDMLAFFADFDSSIVGSFAAVYTLDLFDQSGIPGGGSRGSLELTLLGTVSVSVSSVIPEPSSLAIWALLAPALMLRRRRRRR